MAIQTIKLNMIPGSVLPVVNVSQYDDKRTFYIDVYMGPDTYDLAGKTVEIRGTKPDMHGFAYGTTDGVVSVSGNRVTISTTQQMTAVGGNVAAELRVTYSGQVIGSLNFIIAVEPSALSDDTIMSDTDIPVIERYLESIVDDCEEQALIAEGYAVGKQNGSAVGSGSPYYHNNADYYATQAAGSAIAASGSATAAGNSATSAGNSATSASNNALKSEGYAVGKQNGSAVSSGSPYYHNNADYYNTQAAGSATAAGNSATAAAADALEAEGFTAGTQNGVPVGSGSPYYHNNAKYYSEQSNPTTLSSLTDVNLSSPTNDQVLKYDAATGKWVNGTGGGSGVPSGGTTDQALIKNSNTDGDVKWASVAMPDDIERTVGWVGGNALPRVTSPSGGNKGITYTVGSNGAIVFSGTATDDDAFFLYGTDGGDIRPISEFGLEPGETYTFEGIPGGADNTYTAAIVFYRNHYTLISIEFISGDQEAITVPANTTGIIVEIAVASGVTVPSGTTYYPMAYKGTKPSVFAPYHPSVEESKWDTDNQKVAGAYNLCPNNAVSQVKNTVTFTVNDDLSITANGTPNAGTALSISTTTLPAGKYKVIATPDGSTTHYMTVSKQGTTIARSFSGNDVFTLSQPTLVSMELWVPTGEPLSNVIIKPMITPDLNATYDDYVPYAPTNAECAKKTDITSIIATGSTNGTGATIANGAYFYLNGGLCKAKTDIAANATFTLNTNYEVVTVVEELFNRASMRVVNVSAEQNPFAVYVFTGCLVLFGRLNTGLLGAVYIDNAMEIVPLITPVGATLSIDSSTGILTITKTVTKSYALTVISPRNIY